MAEQILDQGSARMTGDDFHDHLDHCEQCREHPFDLCSTGALLLVQAVQGKLGTEWYVSTAYSITAKPWRVAHLLIDHGGYSIVACGADAAGALVRAPTKTPRCPKCEALSKESRE